MSSMNNIASELQEAVAKLNAFASQPKQTSAFHVNKAIALVRNLLRDKSDQGALDDQAIIQAVELIQRHRLKLWQLAHGSEADQKLVHSVTLAANAYNQRCLEISLQSSKGRFSREKKSTRNLPAINLHRLKTIKVVYPAEKGEVEENIVQATSSIALSKQSVELFQMKVLALLERYEIAPNHEARQMVKRTPIQTALKADARTCTLSQVLTLFPGQTVVVMGSSALNAKTHTIDKLFPDTFSLSLELHQAQYPHAVQRTGWALTSCLLPQEPQRLDLLKQSHALFKARKELINSLMPKGTYFEKAKRMIKLKKQVFAIHGTELLNLHRDFALKLLQVVERNDSESLQTIENFYTALQNDSLAFERLSGIHQRIFQIYIEHPQRVLLDSLLNHSADMLTHGDHPARYDAARAILLKTHEAAEETLHLSSDVQDEQQKLVVQKYSQLMGALIGEAGISIILQYLSEDLGFNPPILTEFQKRLQAMAYQQVDDFIVELNMPLEEDEEAVNKQIYDLLKAEIYRDISFLEAEPNLSIPNELAEYYTTRIPSLS